VQPIGLLALLLLPLEARPLGVVALHLAQAWIIDRGRARRGSVASTLWRGGLVASVLLVLTALPSLAYASPPDPSWIPGLYDDADYDDVVMLATSGVAWVGPDLVLDFQPILFLVAQAPTDPEGIERDRPTPAVRPRAPPAA
jgi:hypothetical protein